MPEIIPQPRSTVTIKSAPSGPQQTLGFCLRTWKVGLTRTRGSEKIAVRAGAGQFKDENVLMNLVDEQPVGCNMAFAVIGPIVAKRVVAVERRGVSGDILHTGWLSDGPNIPGRPFWVMRHRTPLLT